MDPTHPSQPPPITTNTTTPTTPQKIRLMISYGGHILPRPQTKALFYNGGETRIISVSRTTALSLSSLFTSISNSIYGPHNNTPFTLKYQLPHHDLDALITISSNEDLYNMIEEYDRIATTGRIRFFLFDDHDGGDDGGGGGRKIGDEWFVDALKVTGSNPINGREDGVVSPESIVLESSSSFGSNNSSNNISNSNNNNNNNNNNNKSGDDLKVVLPSADSLGSDTSIPSPNFNQQAIVYQDATGFADAKPISVNLVEVESSASDQSPRNEIVTPVQVSGYMISKPPMEQPQHQLPTAPPPPTHYIRHPGPASHSNFVTKYYPSSIPVAYTPMYQTYVQPQQRFQYQITKPYPVYMTPVGQSQNLYDASSVHNLATSQTVSATASQPQVPSNPVVVTPMGYEGYNPTTAIPEYGAKVYRPTSVAAQPVTLPPPVTQTSQPVSAPVLETTNYISNYEDLMHAQVYKTQPSGPTMPSQVQILPESFAQLNMENTKH